MKPEEVMPIVRKTLDRVEYKPGAKFVISEMSNFFTRNAVVTLSFRVRDVHDGGRKIDVISNMQIPEQQLALCKSEGELVELFLELLRKHIHSFEIHEADEWLKFRGEQVFDPHKNEGDQS